MNARWFRENLSVVIFGVAFVAILSVLIWLLMGATAQQTTVMDDLKSQQETLNSLLNSKPPPSDTNIKIVREDRETVHQLYEEMQKAGVRVPLKVRDFGRAVDFSLTLRSNITALAEQARQHKIVTPDSFAFGFSRYDLTLPCQNPSLQDDACKKLLALLAKQLAVIDKLAGILISNKVDRIETILRTEVEGGASANSLAAPISSDPKALYSTYPFEINFVCDTSSLRNVLNSLERADCLFIIRSMTINSVAVKVRGPEPVPDADTTPAPTPPRGRETDPLRAPPEPVHVEAPLLDARRLNVSMRLDFVEFLLAKPKAGKS